MGPGKDKVTLFKFSPLAFFQVDQVDR